MYLGRELARLGVVHTLQQRLFRVPGLGAFFARPARGKTPGKVTAALGSRRVETRTSFCAWVREVAQITLSGDGLDVCVVAKAAGDA